MQTGSPQDRPPATGVMRWLFLCVTGLALALGLVGLFLPVMPTVPFLLVAAWGASRCSPRLHDWLHNHPHFGQALCDWRDGGVVPRRAKWMATTMMACSGIFLLFLFQEQRWIPLATIACMALVAAWLWRRPEHRRAAFD